MSAAEAAYFHESKFIIEEDFTSVANASVNPTHRQVTHLHNKWRTLNLGSQIDPFEKLKEKMSYYESIGKISCNIFFILSYCKKYKEIYLKELFSN